MSSRGATTECTRISKDRLDRERRVRELKADIERLKIARPAGDCPAARRSPVTEPYPVCDVRPARARRVEAASPRSERRVDR